MITSDQMAEGSALAKPLNLHFYAHCFSDNVSVEEGNTELYNGDYNGALEFLHKQTEES